MARVVKLSARKCSQAPGMLWPVDPGDGVVVMDAITDANLQVLDSRVFVGMFF